MPLVINTNVQAANAQRNLGVTGSKMGKALEKLSSGLRINRAADDAAGLAISEKLRAQVRGLGQGARNAQDGISMIQTAEGAMNEVHGILQRMRELAVQAGNSTLSGADRTAIGEEVLTLKNEINNIASRTKFNGLSLLTGSLTTTDNGTGTAKVGTLLTTNGPDAMVSSWDVSKLSAGSTYTIARTSATTATLTSGTTVLNATVSDGTIGADGRMTINFTGSSQSASVTIVGAAAKTVDETLLDLNTLTVITAAGSGSATYQVGSEASDTISVGFNNLQATAIGTGGSEIGVLVTDNSNVDSVVKANTLLTSIDAAIGDVSAQRGKLGAAQNQMEAAINSLGVSQENLSASESRIRDADIAQVTTQLVSAQIMQQAGVSVLSQANSSAQVVTTLLQKM